MYIGIMYSMCAFGPVCGFLLGAYLLSHHVDTFTIDVAQMLIGENRNSDCLDLAKESLSDILPTPPLHRSCLGGRKGLKL